MKLVLSFIAITIWAFPQYISELDIPTFRSSSLEMDTTITFYPQQTVNSFMEKSVASNRKMRHRKYRSKPSPKNNTIQ